MSLQASTQFAVKTCEKLGADEAEAFAQEQRTIEVVVERGEIQNERVKAHKGIGIRFIKDKKLGFAFSSDTSNESPQATCHVASILSKTSIPNPDWVSLPAPAKVLKAIGVYNKEVAAFNTGDVLSLTKQAYKAVKEYDKRAFIDDGKFTVTSTEVAISNSYGIDLAEKSTFLFCYLVCVAKERGEVSSMGFEYEVARSMQFSPEKMGKSAAKKAIASLRPKPVKSFKGKVILDSDPAARILIYPVISSVNAENAQRQRSIWLNKLGKEVAVKQLNIVDDGLLPRGAGSSSFDGEGVPCQKTAVITKGMLKGFLHDSFTANKEKRKSTGNANRENYNILPTISSSNFFVKPGKKKLEEMIAGVDKGIFVRRFSGNVRPDSGEFSGITKQASYIEKGEIKHALKETMISGNTFKVLKNIVEIGSEIRPTFFLGKAYVPPILLENVTIISK
ncbi:MAG: TldD/PmbA family protein [Candidatus Bathyarchaeia archaeon]